MGEGGKDGQLGLKECYNTDLDPCLLPILP